ncbi:MAG: Fe-S-binding domain-containing protein, partial [Actinomycetota bacterium]
LWAVLGSLGIVLAALYLLWAYQRVMHGPLDREENRTLDDLRPREIALLAPMVAMIVVLGVYPKPFLDKMEPSLKQVVARVQQANAAPGPLAQKGGR